MRRLLLVILAAGWLGSAADAQQRSLTIDDIFGPGSAERFSGRSSASLTWLADPWLDDAHYLWPADDATSPRWMKVEALSDRREPLFDPARLMASLTRIVGPDRAATAGRRRPTL